MSEQLSSANHDPNYKWRVIGGIGVIFFTAASVTMTAIFSAALSAGYIAGLFGMEFGLVLIVILLVLTPPSGEQRWFSMDNPKLGVPLGILITVLGSLFLKWIGAD
jgi:hypothetical protein